MEGGRGGRFLRPRVLQQAGRDGCKAGLGAFTGGLRAFVLDLPSVASKVQKALSAGPGHRAVPARSTALLASPGQTMNEKVPDTKRRDAHTIWPDRHVKNAPNIWYCTSGQPWTCLLDVRGGNAAVAGLVHGTPSFEEDAMQQTKALQQSWSLQHGRRSPFLSAQRASKSLQHHEFPADKAPETLAKDIHNTIIQRMKDDNLDTSHLNASLTQFLTPGSKAGREFSGLTDADMVAALNLRESTADDNTDALDVVDGVELFYVRSWALSVRDLKQILLNWEEQDLNIPEAFEWMTKVLLEEKRPVVALSPAGIGTSSSAGTTAAGSKRKTDEDEDVQVLEVELDGGKKEKVLSVRYVGKCTAPVTPHERFVADQVGRKSGLLNEFLNALEEVCPDTYAAGKTYEFPRGRLDEYVSEYSRDDRERSVIAFFNRSTLLNRQPGGFYSSYTPDSSDVATFVALKTDFFQRFRAFATPCGSGKKQAIIGWRDEMATIADQNPVDTGTAVRPFTDDLLNALLKQALPYTVNGHTVLVLIGKDITREDYLGAKTFLKGGSRAGYLTADFLARLQALENGIDDWDAATLDTIGFPFVDLYPWLKHKNWLLALNQLVAYLQAAQPVVSVTFSRRVTAFAMTNFYYPYGLPSSQRFLDFVGVPSLQHYADRSWLSDPQQASPPAGFSTIVIPHLHPGRDKYGSQPKQLRRVFDLTWMVTLMFADAATQAANNSSMDHDTLCLSVLQMYDRANPGLSASVKHLYAKLDQAKAELATYWENETMRAATRVLSKVTRERLRAGARERIEFSQAAEGAPFSVTRQAQVDMLWKLAIPDLAIHMKDPSDEKTWKAWALSLKETTSYYTSALRRATFKDPAKHPLRNILAPFAPEGAIDDSWMADPTLTKQAIDEKSKQLVAGLPEDFFSSANQSKRRRDYLAAGGQAVTGPHKIDKAKYHASWHGREVKVGGKNGEICLFWHDTENDEYVIIHLRVTTRLGTVLETDRRYIQFMEDGIGLTDETGAYLTKGQKRIRTLIPYANLHHIGEPDATRALRLATQERKASSRSTSATAGPSRLPRPVIIPAPSSSSTSAAAGPSGLPRQPFVPGKSLLPPPTKIPPSLFSLGTRIQTTGTAPSTHAPGQPASAPPAPIAQPPPARGRDPFRSPLTPKKAGEFALPVKPEDGIWPMKKWLESAFPNGGLVTAADPTLHPKAGAHSFKTLFGGYLDQSFSTHWSYRLWKDWLGQANYTKNIVANLKFLRPRGFKDTRIPGRTSSGLDRKYSIYEFGPP
ncbi:uncharacterized protein EV422DRAFT_509318 [Fimicolochytrium jonesii]|uniref:uncharacterized protein n=1 Tax=Fimicolochytrium jonesii TaxID=1396493 RepID=UPI0022FE6366|nr:uncharacterized protein EV422DRAFT_509318 [Fimicolochytrium jonesii]KAI8817104.1 hypothetical protein EV422DRAFT_509318 [Fimicolochytrium jonesii]